MIPKDLKTQSKAIFVWYQKERVDLKAIHEENDVLRNNKLVVVRGLLRESEYGCLYMQSEYPRGFGSLNHVSGDYFK